ncbi:MAG: hypothetical protein ACR652_05570 [Methylocystis sp.]|uniref:hypothetical protein n=1 Tax=Methylocystis sp. TaxID=1911079 RepID=UPI003DA27487
MLQQPGVSLTVWRIRPRGRCSDLGETLFSHLAFSLLGMGSGARQMIEHTIAVVGLFLGTILILRIMLNAAP